MTLIMNGQDVDVIADHIAPSKQGWTREVTVRTAGHKIRATVYRDFYAFQSRIYVEVWNPASLSWNNVRTLSGSDHKDLPSSSLQDKSEIFKGTADLVDELIAYAQEVLA